jgi:hypothetical protein
MAWLVRTSQNTQIWMAGLVIDNGWMSLQNGGSARGYHVVASRFRNPAGPRSANMQPPDLNIYA